MHLADGILPPLHCLAYFIVVILLVVLGIRNLRRRILEYGSDYLRLFLVLTAIVFVLSAWHIPVPVAGSCSHPCGTPLAGLILSVPEVFLMSFCVLIVQALYGHGGFTTLGANTLSLALIPSVLGYLTRKYLLSKLEPHSASRGIALFAVGVLGDLGVYLTTSVELALAWGGASIMRMLNLACLTFLLYMPIQLPISLIDGLVTMKLLDYILSRFDVTKNVLRISE